MPMPSMGGKMNPKIKRSAPAANPANGPAADNLRRTSRLGTILKILVIAPKDPICK